MNIIRHNMHNNIQRVQAKQMINKLLCCVVMQRCTLRNLSHVIKRAVCTMHTCLMLLGLPTIFYNNVSYFIFGEYLKIKYAKILYFESLL